MCNRIYLIVLCLIVALSARAQVPRLYTVEQGLHGSRVEGLYVDQNNFVWVSTEGALDCFDGYRFHRIELIDRKTGMPVFNVVRGMMQIDDRHFLLLTNIGLFDFDVYECAFHHIPVTDNPDIKSVSLQQALPLPEPDTYLLTSDGYGCFVVNIKTKKVDEARQRKINSIIQQAYMGKGIVDSKGCLWLSDHSHKLTVIDGKTMQPRKVNVTPEAASILAAHPVTNIVENAAHTHLYFTTSRGGVLVFDHASATLRPIRGNHNNLLALSIANTTDGHLLVGSDNSGLWLLDPKTEELTPYGRQWSSVTDMSFAKVHHLTADRDGNIIAGLYQKGMLVIPQRKSGFDYTALSANGGTNNSACITSLTCDSKGALWAATDGAGVFCNARRIEGEPTLTQSIITDRRGDIWIANWGGGLRCSSDGTTFVTPDYLRSYAQLNFMSLTYDSKNDVLYAASNGQGVFIIDLNTHNVTPMVNTLSINWVNEIYYDESAALLWVGDALYAYIYDVKRKSCKRLEPKPGIVCVVRQFIPYGQNMLMVTNHGIYCYDRRQDKFVDVPNLTDMGDRPFFSIIRSGDDFWITAVNTLHRVNPTTGRSVEYHSFGGITLGDFHGHACAATPDGRIHFGADNGIISFNPKTLTTPIKQMPQLYVSSINVKGQELLFLEDEDDQALDAPVFFATKLELPRGANSFEVSFCVPEHSSPSRIAYEYTLEGYEDEIHVVNSDFPGAYYASLPCGTYKLRVRAYYEDAPDTYSERILEITVPYPWYASVWAWIAYIVIITALALYIRSIIKERRRAKHQLQESQQSERVKEDKLRLFTSIAHELRSPLTMIVSPLEQMMRRDHDEDRQESYRIMHLNCKRLLHIVRQITDVRRIDNGQFHLHFRSTEFTTYLSNIMGAFTGMATDRSISFSTESCEQLGEVWIDPIHFEKIITNLLSNAFKFTPIGGRIFVRTSVQLNTPNSSGSSTSASTERRFSNPLILEYLELSIYNSGSHLDDDDLKHLWERFYQGHTKESAMGSGIGLNLCYELVRLHHGSIEARNVGNDGVEFIVRVPIGNAHLTEDEMREDPNAEEGHSDYLLPEASMPEKTPETAAEERSDAQPETKPAQPAAAEATPAEPVAQEKTGAAATRPVDSRFVLVVDDDEELCRYVAQALSDEYTVEMANGGNEAWQKILSLRPSVVVTDLMMPDGDGFELTRRIKNNPETDHIGVIVLTSENDEESRLRTVTLDADHFLPKPFNIPLLKGSLQQVLRVRENIRNKMRRTDLGHNYTSVKVDSPEDRLISRVKECVLQHLDDSDYSVLQLSEEVGLSRVHLNRKLKEHFGISPNAYIRSVRLKQAAFLLVHNHVNISEVAYRVGFSSHSYFTSNFHDFFGMSPKEFVNFYSDETHQEALRKLLE